MRNIFYYVIFGELLFFFSCIVSVKKPTGVCRRISDAISSATKLAPVFHGIGYVASKDDSLVVLGSRDIGLDWDYIITQFEVFFPSKQIHGRKLRVPIFPTLML